MNHKIKQLKIAKYFSRRATMEELHNKKHEICKPNKWPKWTGNSQLGFKPKCTSQISNRQIQWIPTKACLPLDGGVLLKG